MGGAFSRFTKLAVALTFTPLLVFGGPAPAADNTLSWWHGGCSHSVSFDAAQLDEARLRNTVHLLYGPPDFKAPSIGLPFNPRSVARVNLEHVGRECRGALDVAGRLEFLPLTGIEEYRRALMEEIADTCAFETAQIRGFQDPSALRDYKPAEACTPFADALEGKRDTMAAFRQTLDHHCAGADQAACVERELARARQDDGGDWMRLYLVKFGWNMCAIEFTSRHADSQKLEQMRAGLESQFQHAFKVTRHGCDAVAAGQPELRSVPATPASVPSDKLAPGKPASRTASAGKPNPAGCSLTPAVRGRRSEAEKALCAAGHGLARSAAAKALPTPFAADKSRQDLSYGRR